MNIGVFFAFVIIYSTTPENMWWILFCIASIIFMFMDNWDDC